jgi:RsiW-degrading membrane proteinase PrsW (M82 family)
MDVYISSHGSQKGPYSLEQIRQMQERHEILPTDYAWYKGLPAWVPVNQLQPDGTIGPPPLHQKASFRHGAAAAFGHMADRVTSVAGVEKIEGLHRKEFFAEIFKKRTDDEIEELFTTGTKTTTPPLQTIDTRWPHPWLFLRAVVAAALLYIGFFFGFRHFGNPNFLPGLILVGSFAIPLATLIFFVEMNAPRNMSLYQIFKLVNAGGVVALIFAVLFGQWGSAFGFQQNLTTLIGAAMIGVVEESAKISAVILFMRNKRFHWTLNGLLIGAAVGTGFAAYESAGYAFMGLIEPVRASFVPNLIELLKHLPQGLSWEQLEDGIRTGLAQLFWGYGVGNMMHQIHMRALLSPLGHIVWTALAAAALWKVKGNNLFQWRMLVDWRFLRVFLLVAACHALWDLTWINNMLWSYTKYLILGFVAWVVALAYVQDGLKQIRGAQQTSGGLPPAQLPVSPT